jgi:CheY-like chemotaxis protein
VEIQSEVGVGTTVHLRFPAANASLAPPSEAGGSALVLPPIRVLLVDDDELIRLTVPPLLHGLGLKVEVAANGLQALEKLEAPDPIDLVILDQNMPMLSGTETLARLRATRPGLPVLFATGYRDAELAALPASYPRLVTLEKPYTIEELRRAIADLLADTQPGQDFGT